MQYFNMHVPVTVNIQFCLRQFRLYFSGSNILNVCSFEIVSYSCSLSQKHNYSVMCSYRPSPSTKQYFTLQPWLAMYHGQELLSSVKTHHGHTPRSHYHRACSNMVGNEKQYYHNQPLAGADCLQSIPDSTSLLK